MPLTRWIEIVAVLSAPLFVYLWKGPKDKTHPYVGMAFGVLTLIEVALVVILVATDTSIWTLALAPHLAFALVTLPLMIWQMGLGIGYHYHRVHDIARHRWWAKYTPSLYLATNLTAVLAVWAK